MSCSHSILSNVRTRCHKITSHIFAKQPLYKILSVIRCTDQRETETYKQEKRMAFRAAITSNLRSSSMVSSLVRNNGRPFATSSTVDAAGSHPKVRSWAKKADFAPIYMVMGMVLVAVSIGVHTAKQQILHSPAVKISKKKRESVTEVEDPDVTVSSADKFISKSFLRKVAHIQDSEHPDPSRPNPFTSPRHSESLKSVGVDPKFRG